MRKYADVGLAYSTYHSSIEDGFEFGFIVPETATDISFMLVISRYSPVRNSNFNSVKMIASSVVTEEYLGKTKISIKANDYLYSMMVYLYITDIGNQNNGTEISAQYFEQRGSLSSRTASFGIIFFVITMLWVIIYGSMRREINMIVRDYRRAWLIRRGKLEAGPSVTKDHEKAFDFVFGDRYT